MNPPVISLCKASSAVTALLGSNPCRVYPAGDAPQGVAKPYAVWQQIGGSPENYLGDTPDIDSLITQFDCYAANDKVAGNVAEALRDVIEQHAYIIAWRGNGKDPETGLNRYSFDAEWLVAR